MEPARRAISGRRGALRDGQGLRGEAAREQLPERTRKHAGSNPRTWHSMPTRRPARKRKPGLLAAEYTTKYS